MSFRSSSQDTAPTSGARVENAIERVPSDLMPLSLLGDARLVRLASRGDEAAFAAIFRRYHQPLYRYCRSITGNSEDASEALRNTMVKAKRALPGERRAIEMKPWLFNVAHNQSISLLRRRPQDAAPEEESHGPAVDGPRRAEPTG
jgi:DNA-directed RNA polymerase specialized sigma24 family protein